MIELSPQVFSRKAFAAAAVATIGLSSLNAQAEDLTLVNPSFELPAIPFPTDPNPEQKDFVLLTIDGWDKTGPFGNDPRAPQGVQDTGVFINIPFDPGSGSLELPTANADGNQLAFMVVNTDSFGPTEEAVTISQTTSTVFEAGKAYTFTMDIGSSFVAPPGVLLGGPVNDPESVELIIGYGGGTGDTITPLATRTVSALELTLDFPTFHAPLAEFEVSTGVLDGLDAAVGENLRVMVRQVGGNSGAFNLDNARLSSVPEPTSLALLGLAGLACLRRRR